MIHKSVLLNTPCEFINITPFNPLISKCQIKVCYVGEQPNRNKSIITKEVATEMANSLPGSPIVGYYNEAKEDFEGHNKIIEISGGEFKLKDTTRPYGFVDLNAKVWFQWFLDDDSIEREYLMTEGWLWTGQWPECKRIIDEGNHQSMELDEDTLNAYWSRGANGERQFFIINEAIISKLCVLGEDVEPCFEGASISQVQFSFEEDFKVKMFEMMNELKELLKGGTNEMSSTEEIKVDDVVIDPVIEDPAPSDPETEPVDPIEPAAAENEGENEDEINKEDPKKTEDSVEDTNPVVDEFENKDDEEEKVCPECGKPESECTCDKKDYSLDSIPEYIELKGKYEKLVADYSSLETEIVALREFKATVEKKDKEAMIASFYMLSDEDKKDVNDNIDSYSLEDIEAKLSIICVRNRVSFDLEAEEAKDEDPTIYDVNNGELSDDDVPAWVKAVRSTAKSMQE